MPDHAGDTGAENRYLRTDGLRDGIALRAVRGGVVTMAAQVVKIAIQVATIVILARLLAPVDFGLFAMVAAILVVLEIFKDFGLSTATVQRRDITNEQVSTLFWLNAGLGVAVAIGTAALAPLLSWIYGEPALLGITPVVAVAFVFTGLAAQHLALLRRQMHFLAVAGVQTIAEIVAMGAAVVAALAGLGYWALVVQRLVWAIAMALGAWMTCDWRPGRLGPLADVRGLVAFGGNATGAMAIGHFVGNLDKMLIGWWWGAAALGLFERTQKLVQMSTMNLTTPLAAVGIPTLCRLLHEPVRYRRAYLAATERLGMVVAPLGGLVVTAADPLVVLILGPKWAPAGPIFAWLGVAMLYMPVTYTLSWLYMSQDRTPEMLRAGLVNAALMAIAIVAGLPFGAVGVAAALAISGAAVRVPALFWLAGRRGPVGVSDLYRVLLLPGAAAFATAGAVWVVRGLDNVAALPVSATVPILLGTTLAASLCVYVSLPHGREILRHGIRTSANLLRREANA